MTITFAVYLVILYKPVLSPFTTSHLQYQVLTCGSIAHLVCFTSQNEVVHGKYHIGTIIQTFVFHAVTSVSYNYSFVIQF